MPGQLCWSLVRLVLLCSMFEVAGFDCCYVPSGQDVADQPFKESNFRSWLIGLSVYKVGTFELSSSFSDEESDSSDEQEEDEEPSLDPDSESEAEQPSDSDSELESTAGSSFGRVRSAARFGIGGSTASSQSGAIVVRGAFVGPPPDGSDSLMASTSRVDVKEEAPQSKEELARPCSRAEGSCL